MKKLEDRELFNVGGNYYLTAKEMKARGMEMPLPKQKHKIIITFGKT